MKYISVFEMLKIGIGPSSSHTLGPWRAAEAFLKEIKEQGILHKISSVKVDLYGSLSLTGKGHATDFAVMLGLWGTDPEFIPVEDIDKIINQIKQEKRLYLSGELFINFDMEKDIVFNKNFLPFHANGLKFTATGEAVAYESTFYSVGGGFIVKEETDTKIQNIDKKEEIVFPYPFEYAKDLLLWCEKENKKISQIVLENEKCLREEGLIKSELDRIWQTMLECAYIGCHTQGTLSGGLGVVRRAYQSHKNIIKEQTYTTPSEWIQTIRSTKIKFREIFKLTSCYALAVNEVNASLGRVVTAPTNGSSGVIPAVLLYYLTIHNHKAGREKIAQFLLTSGVIGSLFKKHATISAAMGGCQAEIGVSSAMAAGALCELLGGSPSQVFQAAEIAMEHHLGLTCDPVGGLVQIPCIERNAMGALKAINAAEMSLDNDPKTSKVSLDAVIKTMWKTSLDMHRAYKETSEGGLATEVDLKPLVSC